MLISIRNPVRRLTLALLGWSLLVAARAQEGPAESRTISVEAVRPMYEAIRQLRVKYGWLISYQDPPFEHPDELMPRKDAPNGQRHMIPRRMGVSVDYLEPQAGDLQGQRRAIERIVNGFGAAGAGQFRVVYYGNYSFVLPASVRRANGVRQDLASICDVRVSFPPAVRTIDEVLALILPKLSEQLHAPIIRGTDPINLFMGHSHLTEANDEPVCQVMARTFDGANQTRAALRVPLLHVVWALLYDATEREYAFNAAIAEPPQDETPYNPAARKKAEK